MIPGGLNKSELKLQLKLKHEEDEVGKEEEPSSSEIPEAGSDFENKMVLKEDADMYQKSVSTVILSIKRELSLQILFNVSIMCLIQPSWSETLIIVSDHVSIAF